MNGEINIESLPLTTITYRARKILSLLLNSSKVLVSDGPDKLPRDWRGIASLANISGEETADFRDNTDKTQKVLEIWIEKDGDQATIGNLFRYLQRIDRFDVYDDLITLNTEGELFDITPQKQLTAEAPEEDLITLSDRPGAPQFYHAYVLHASEDQGFVDEMLMRLRGVGFKLCTEQDLLPGVATKYVQVSRLISERCHRIVLVYSPEFLNSPANSFYTNYAQAVGIEMRRPKIIPCMYRKCALPSNLQFYHQLYYSRPGESSVYDFWDKLAQALDAAAVPRLQTSTKISSQSSINITEVQQTISDGFAPTNFLTPPQIKAKSRSLNGLNTTMELRLPDDTRSVSSELFAQTSDKKKVGKIRKLINTIKGKKKAIMIEN